MNENPYLIFLHGVGKGDPEQKWHQALLDGLEAAGYPRLAGVNVISPRYIDALSRLGEERGMPPVRSVTPQNDRARKRREFERRTAAMEARLARHTGGSGAKLADAAVGAAARARIQKHLKQANNYLTRPAVRASVQHELVRQMPDRGRAVIVAHSLGTVVAADLIPRLSPGLEISGVVTIGSPLASARFASEELKETMAEPPANVAWWVNYWSYSDPVTALRGIASVYPWILDLRVPTPALPVSAHAAKGYLSHPLVAEAVGYGLFGSKSKEIVLAKNETLVRPDGPEQVALEGLRFAHFVAERLKGERRERYFAALRQVQARTVSDLIRRADAENRLLSPFVAELDQDPGGTDGALAVPQPVGYASKEEAIRRLVALSEQNVLAPFEIDVKEEVRREAFRDLTKEMDLGSEFGARVFEARGEADKALSDSAKSQLKKWGVMGAGTAALLVGASGIFLAPAAGLAGAAALTSGLASFGPGGMIGGLMTAGAFLTSGAAASTYGAFSLASTPENVEALARSQLATLILRKQESLPPDDNVWFVWKESESHLIREIHRVEQFSDKKSSYLADLEKKLKTVQRAMAYAVDKGLAPEVVQEAAAGTGPRQAKFWSRRFGAERTEKAERTE